MSAIADKIYDILNQLFPPMPHKRVFRERYINYKGQKLFFDFYVKELKLYIEVQGQQHRNFVKHFHGSKENFVKQKYRDNLKIRYIQENDGLCLIRFNFDETITYDLVYKKIKKVLEGECFYE